jgi:RimJ/RimL family protein N-acetyltransferase
LLNYAFNELNLNRVQLTVNADNPRAVRAYQKAGFQEEGRAREAFFRDGRWQDMLYMAVLRRDFKRK